MKRITMLIMLLAFLACEDKKDDESKMVGTWELSNLGEYANANCTGAVDNSGWALAQAFGIKGTIELKDGGTGTYTITFGDEKQEIAITWDESKSQICFMGVECNTYKLDGDSFSMDNQEEAYCEDDYGEETNHATQSECEAAGNTWEEASCQVATFTKK